MPSRTTGSSGPSPRSAWSNSLARYAGITRLWDRATKQRLVGRTESLDFLQWTKAEEILRADPKTPESQTYAMPIFEYAGLYIGLLMMFHVPSDTVACALAWSADTLHWERVDPGNALIPLAQRVLLSRASASGQLRRTGTTHGARCRNGDHKVCGSDRRQPAGERRRGYWRSTRERCR